MSMNDPITVYGIKKILNSVALWYILSLKWTNGSWTKKINDESKNRALPDLISRHYMPIMDGWEVFWKNL